MARAVLRLLLAGLALCHGEPSPQAGGEGSCPAGGCAGEEEAPVQISEEELQQLYEDMYHWPRSRGHIGSQGTSPVVGPREPKKALLWSWEHPEKLILPGAVLFDDDLGLYTPAMDGVRKFSKDGELLWFYESKHGMVISNPCLWNGRLFGTTNQGFIFSLDMETGQELWAEQHAEGCEMDTPYVEVSEGVVLSAWDREATNTSWIQGNVRLLGVSAVDGEKIWEYKAETVHWNFAPALVGDGTFLTMDIHGGVSRMRAADGKFLWKVAPPLSAAESYTDGGMILGPGTEVAYTCSNEGSGFDGEGALRAYRVSDGERLWSATLPLPCVSWPAVDAENATVVVPIGPLPVPVPPTLLLAFPVLAAFAAGLMLHVVGCVVGKALGAELKGARCGCCVLDLVLLMAVLALPLLHTYSVSLGQGQGGLWRTEPRRMQVCAFDAQSGARRWCYEVKPAWGKVNAANDEEDFPLHLLKGHFRRPVCGPASWGGPTIDGKGRVFVSGMNGVFYAIKDENGDGEIGEGEVAQMDVAAAALHAGPSFAPGLMALGTCNRIHVFRACEAGQDCGA